MAADEIANIEDTSTRFVYENRGMRVREDTIPRRDGSTGIYGLVEKPDFEQLFEPHVRFFLARLEGVALGPGASPCSADWRCELVDLKLICFRRDCK